jgi:hypothetical protein
MEKTITRKEFGSKLISAGHAPSLLVLRWHLLYNGGNNSEEKPTRHCPVVQGLGELLADSHLNFQHASKCKTQAGNAGEIFETL